MRDTQFYLGKSLKFSLIEGNVISDSGVMSYDGGDMWAGWTQAIDTPLIFVNGDAVREGDYLYYYSSTTSNSFISRVALWESYLFMTIVFKTTK